MQIRGSHTACCCFPAGRGHDDPGEPLLWEQAAALAGGVQAEAGQRPAHAGARHHRGVPVPALLGAAPGLPTPRYEPHLDVLHVCVLSQHMREHLSLIDHLYKEVGVLLLGSLLSSSCLVKCGIISSCNTVDILQRQWHAQLRAQAGLRTRLLCMCRNMWVLHGWSTRLHGGQSVSRAGGMRASSGAPLRCGCLLSWGIARGHRLAAAGGSCRRSSQGKISCHMAHACLS